MGTSASKIEQLIDGIYDFIDDCRTSALSNNKVIVPRDRLYDLLDELRLRTPDEIKRYQKIIANRDAIISDAEAKASAILAEAQAEASKLTSSHKITVAAQAEAKEIVNKANEEADEVLTSAKNESEKILNKARGDASELIKGARDVASNMTKNAKDESEQMVSESYEYANELLGMIEKILSETVNESRVKFEAMYKVLSNSLYLVKDNREQINATQNQPQLEKKEDISNNDEESKN